MRLKILRYRSGDQLNKNPRFQTRTRALNRLGKSFRDDQPCHVMYACHVMSCLRQQGKRFAFEVYMRTSLCGYFPGHIYIVVKQNGCKLATPTGTYCREQRVRSSERGVLASWWVELHALFGIPAGQGYLGVANDHERQKQNNTQYDCLRRATIEGMNNEHFHVLRHEW